MLYIEPCPYCKHIARFYFGGSYVECTDHNCGSRGPIRKIADGEISESDAIHAWNVIAEQW